MGVESFSTVNFEKNLATVVDNAWSLKEIETWLKMQQCVYSVRLTDYLLKSNPPQRVFVIEFKMKNGETVKKTLNIFDCGNQQFQFNKLQDEL